MEGHLLDRRPAELGVEPRINLKHVGFYSTSPHMNPVLLNQPVGVRVLAVELNQFSDNFMIEYLLVQI